MGIRGQIAIAAIVAGAMVADPREATAGGARVVVRAVADQPVPAELVETLRIYLSPAATVDIGAPLVGGSLDQRIAEASAGLAHGALVGTWLERAPGADGAYTVVVVGERDGRAAVEVGKLDGSDTTGISRLLALRIGAFLDDTLAAGPSSPLASARPHRALRPIGEVGGGGTGDSDGVHGEVAVAAGVRHGRRSYRIEAVAIGRFGWPRRTREVDGEIALGLFDLAAGGRFVVPAGPTWLGAAIELGARRVRAEGVAPDGGSGTAVRWLPMFRVGLDTRLELGAGIAMRASLAIERGLEVEQFTVRGAPLAEVGTLAATAGLSLVVPLDRP